MGEPAVSFVVDPPAVGTVVTNTLGTGVAAPVSLDKVGSGLAIVPSVGDAVGDPVVSPIAVAPLVGVEVIKLGRPEVSPFIPIDEVG